LIENRPSRNSRRRSPIDVIQGGEPVGGAGDCLRDGVVLANGSGTISGATRVAEAP
jgi:hypothetical protein